MNASTKAMPMAIRKWYGINPGAYVSVRVDARKMV